MLEKDRPLILIGHSLGGLVIKQVSVMFSMISHIVDAHNEHEEVSSWTETLMIELSSTRRLESAIKI